MRGESEPLPVYQLHPPKWLPKAHKAADIGYPGYDPPRPGQDEDVLSESNVKNGYSAGQPVPTEYSGTQDAFKEFIFVDAILRDLEIVANEIFTRRLDNVPVIPPSSFKIPSRVTLNDAKRQAWFADLADPTVPLYKLGKSVPHGAKGHDLLDLLQTNNVAIPRAAWFLRVFGANETAGLRNKPTYNPTQYSVDWANVVTSYMKKQLADIALPSAPRPGLNIKHTFKSVLSDGETRDRWISRFTYCLKLLRTFYVEGLVDNCTFLVWLVQQMSTCNLAQVGFVTRLADEYLDGLLGSRALSRCFAEACLVKLSEIVTTFAQGHLVNLEIILRTLLQRICLSLPDSFVSPAMWTAHSALITQVLSANLVERIDNDQMAQSHRDVCQILSDNLADIESRNKSMLSCHLPPRLTARLGSIVADIQTLNSICNTSNLNTIIFFSETLGSTSTFVEKLDTLLTWSVTPLQYGDHRPHAAATLLREWRDRHGDRAIRRDFTSPDEFLQDELFEWLDSSEVAGHEANLRAVAALYGKLVKYELFSYANYIQRLIARGEPCSLSSEGPHSRHRNFLQWIPLHQSTPSLLNQRKASLYGVRTRETVEDLKAKEIRREIRNVIPMIFGDEPHPAFTSSSKLREDCYTLLAAPRFEQVRIFKQWFLPTIRKYIGSRQIEESIFQQNLLKMYCIAVELLDCTKCHGTMLELSLLILQHSSTIDLLTAVLETLRRFSLIWISMDVTGDITAALYSAHQVWRTRGIQTRALMDLLLEIDDGRHLGSTAREHVVADMASFAHALYPGTEHPCAVPTVLPEILLLAKDPDPEAPSMLANSLWYKYRTALDWAWKVWDNAVASIRQIPAMSTDTAARHACALRYGHFLLHVDHHLPAGFDHQILEWFLGMGRREVSALSADSWNVFTVVLLHLCVNGALSTITIFRGIIYPAWQMGANAQSEHQAESSLIYLAAANNLWNLLLLQEDTSVTETLPASLFDIQRILTRRQEVYREPQFSFIASGIPILVFLEGNSFLPDSTKATVKSLRCEISSCADFRQACYRNMDAIRLAFERPLTSGTMDEALCQPLVDALKLVLSGLDAVDISPMLTLDTRLALSPWRLAATTVQTQFALKQLGRALAHEPTSQAASISLDSMTSTLFHSSMSSEEAFFIAEMARGVECPVAVKFLNNGLQCIVEILENLPASIKAKELAERVEQAAEVARVLASVSAPLRQSGQNSSLPFDSLFQERLLGVLNDGFSATETMLTSQHEQLDAEVISQITQVNTFFARLLQFHLGFSEIWASRSRELSAQLASTLFRVILLHASGHYLSLVAYPLLFDTLLYLIDELSAHSKGATFDPFRCYPQIAVSELSMDIPAEYRDQLRSLLPDLPPNAAVENLAIAYRDSSGQLVYGGAVSNRPWEWIENLGDPATNDQKEDSKEKDQSAKSPIKNSGSLSLDLFAAHLTGEHVYSRGTFGVKDSSRVEGDIRTFEDGLTSESLFRRDWRETRTGLHQESVVGSAVKGEDKAESGALPASPFHGRISSRKASPASSVRSRGSTHGSFVSRKQSPTPSGLNRASASTMTEGVDTDSVGTSASAKKQPKRKAENDGEVEIIEGPVSASSRSKKAKMTKPSAKSKAKKR